MIKLLSGFLGSNVCIVPLKGEVVNNLFGFFKAFKSSSSSSSISFDFILSIISFKFIFLSDKVSIIVLIALFDIYCTLNFLKDVKSTSIFIKDKFVFATSIINLGTDCKYLAATSGEVVSEIFLYKFFK